MRRWISVVLTVAMLMPAMAACAEGTMATWLSPQPGQIVSGGRVEVAVGYNTQSKLKVSSLELYVDGQFHSRKVLRIPESRGVCSFAWDTTRVEQGTHNLVVKVLADDQVISKLYGTGTVGPNGSRRGLLDVRPPVVTFSSVKSGDVLKGVTTIKMNAADDSGQAPMVSLLVDDVMKLLKNTPPYKYDLDTSTYPDGDHSLKTYAYDGAGNRSDPAVAKVAFRNGAAKPVVTTLSVDHSPETDLGDATMTKAVPPSIAVNVELKIKKSAARAENQIESSTSSVAPVVAESRVKSKPVTVAAAPKPVVIPKLAPVAPKLESNLKPVPVATRSDLRSIHAAPRLDTRMAAAVPAVKTAAPVAQRSAPALSAKPVKMASVASDMSIRGESVKPAMSAASASAKPVVMDAPQASAVHTTSAAKLSETRSISKAAPVAAIKIDAAVPKILATATPVAKPVVSSTINVPKLSNSDLKRIRVAMAPDLRSASEKVCPSPAIACPPSIHRPTKARIEKTTIPASGKVKARNFFEKMGGVLFWDPSTHTVTACVGSMVLEMKIGSKTAKANGREFQMVTAPQLINNRTIFDAGAFAQACAVIDSKKIVGKAELD